MCSLSLFNRMVVVQVDTTSAKIGSSISLRNHSREAVSFDVGVVVNETLNVNCSRSYYCSPSICTTIRLSGIDQGVLEDFLFLKSSRSIRIQYWGDSIQAQMECDMRQWMYDHSDLYDNNLSYSVFTSDYVQIGCPWRKCVPEGGWNRLRNLTKEADVVVFNLGAHYEFQDKTFFEEELKRYEQVLVTFVEQGGLLIVRSPSPTHFETPDGLYTPVERNKVLRNAGNRTCSPIQSMPPIVEHQDRNLKAFAERQNATYLDVYGISKERSFEHTEPNKKGIDCKHFCQNCGLFRAWNALAVSKIMQAAP